MSNTTSAVWSHKKQVERGGEVRKENKNKALNFAQLGLASGSVSRVFVVA
jgi:hypothetical protein